jgi:hypothetical protein
MIVCVCQLALARSWPLKEMGHSNCRSEPSLDGGSLVVMSPELLLKICPYSMIPAGGRPLRNGARSKPLLEMGLSRGEPLLEVNPF